MRSNGGDPHNAAVYAQGLYLLDWRETLQVWMKLIGG